MSSDHDRALANLAVQRKILDEAEARSLLLEVAASPPGMTLEGLLRRSGRLTDDQLAVLDGEVRAREATRVAPATGSGPTMAVPGEPAGTLPPELFAEDRYELREVLGEGGMGRVTRAWDRRLRRSVAMKVIRHAGVAQEQMLRFVEEAQATAQLQHPSIVPIHDVGLDRQGNLYFTMKEVEGRTLRDVIDRLGEGHVETTRQFPRVRMLQIFSQISYAVGFGHSKGVIHRDLKPDNVMIGAFGEVFVMDWGLAKVLRRDGPVPAGDTSVRTARSAGDSERTMDGVLAGTPHYMSPEQAAGRVESLDARADIWALGALLFEMLTFRRAIEGDSIVSVLENVKLGIVRRAGPGVPREIAAIAAKALRLDREERYASASEMVDDVQAYQEGRRGSAWTETPWSLTAKWARRHRTATMSLGAAAVACAAVLGWWRTRPGILDLSTYPAGAEIRIDGAPAGRTPLRGVPLSPGRHMIEMRLAGHRDESQVVAIAPGAPGAWSFNLFSLSGLLNVTSTPAGARVLVDGVAVGTTTLTMSVPSGRREVRVDLAGYLPHVEMADVAGGNALHRIEAALRKNVGRLRVQTAQEHVTLALLDPADRRIAARLPVSDGMEVPAGTWTARFEKDGCHISERPLEVARDGEAEVAVALTPRELWRSAEKFRPNHSTLVADLDGDGRLEVFVAEKEGGVRALDAATGKSNWRRTREEIGSGNRFALCPCPGRCDVIIAGEVLARLDGRDGKTLWSAPLEGDAVTSIACGLFQPLGEPEIVLGQMLASGFTLESRRTSDGGRSARTISEASIDTIALKKIGLGRLLLAASFAGAWKEVFPLTLDRIAEGTAGRFLSVGDVSGDESDDVLCVHENGTVEVFTPGKPAHWSRSPGGTAYSGIIADLDGDGSAEVVLALRDGEIVACEGRDGADRWRASIGGARSILSAGDLEGDGRVEVLAGGADGRLHVIRFDGTEAWTHPTEGSLTAAPSLADVTSDGVLDVAIVLPDGSVCVLDGAADARARWKRSFGGSLHAPPIVHGGSGDARIAAVENHQALACLRIEDGFLLGRWKPERSILDAFGAGDGYGVHVFSLGIEVRDRGGALLSTSLESGAVIRPSAVGDLDGDGTQDVAGWLDGEGAWAAWSGATGRRLWTSRAPAYATELRPVGGDLIAGAGQESMVLLQAGDGVRAWSHPLSGTATLLAASRSWIVATGKPRRLWRARSDGQQMGNMGLSGTPRFLALCGTERIAIALDSGGIAGCDLVDLRTDWTLDLRGEISSLDSAVDGGRLLAAGLSGGTAILIEPATGRVLWTHRIPGSGACFVRFASGGRTLLVVREDGSAAALRTEAAQNLETWQGGAGPSFDGRHSRPQR